ncbi:hypothetical protein GGQ87_000135 [Brevundimonas alba]|uniref:Uncharacterized protein n=1 Tax=Brevundimonas alba TaxID=74314 RepID=A0A7X6BM14_9CAUL|nr:DUF5946 family protein [Brevundimonas alba]NJC39877.1 hypothetical protein [Brevundimonas alba]
MDAPADIDVCPGCGSRLRAVEGPTHAYMTSSPACWAAFNAVMAREYSDPGLMAVHRLSVDAWAVQHPGDGSRRAIQSVGLHLARLMVQIEQGLEGEAANAAMLGFAARKGSLPDLPPRARYAVTVADVVDAVEPDAHRAAVRRWAAAAWADWADHHDFIRRWAQDG